MAVRVPQGKRKHSGPNSPARTQQRCTSTRVREKRAQAQPPVASTQLAVSIAGRSEALWEGISSRKSRRSQLTGEWSEAGELAIRTQGKGLNGGLVLRRRPLLRLTSAYGVTREHVHA